MKSFYEEAYSIDDVETTEKTLEHTPLGEVIKNAEIQRDKKPRKPKKNGGNGSPDLVIDKSVETVPNKEEISRWLLIELY